MTLPRNALSNACKCLRRNLGLWLMLVIPLSTATNVAAHDGPEQDIDEIVVIGRWTDLAGTAISASEGFVGQEELDIRPRLRTGEVLEVVPGLIVTQHSGTGKSNQMFLRGFNLDHGTDFSTSIDGMPVNLPSHGHGQGYTDLNFLIPELIESVEFRKGPYHASVGDFSSTGSSHLSTFRILPESILKLGIGQDGHRQLLLADSVSVGSGSLLYAAQGHVYDGPWVDIREGPATGERHVALLAAKRLRLRMGRHADGL